MSDTTLAELKYLIERQREEIKTINEVGRLLNSASDPQAIMRLVASYLRQTFPLALCGILLTESRRIHIFRFAKIAQVDEAGSIRDLCAKASELLRRPVLDEELAHVVEDLDAGQWPQASIGYLRSSHMAPLRSNDRTIGLLAVLSGKPDAFGAEDRHALDIVAEQMGAALRNAVLVDELKQANQLKHELLMVISHELRIPLTSILEGVNLVRDGTLGPVSDDQKDFLNTVRDNATRLDRLVEKVVTATQLVTGQILYSVKDLDWAALLKDVAHTLQPLAASRSVDLKLVGAERPLQAAADEARMKQAITHLVENALQATDTGGFVTVTCADAGTAVEIHVKDTGCGIPAAILPRLFEQFRIVGGVDDRKTGGLGLGLFIAHAFTESHGGTIQVNSEVGAGTDMTVRVPKKPPETIQNQRL